MEHSRLALDSVTCDSDASLQRISTGTLAMACPTEVAMLKVELLLRAPSGSKAVHAWIVIRRSEASARGHQATASEKQTPRFPNA